MSSYVRRAFCAYAAAAAVTIVPLTSRGQDVPVHHSAQAGLAQAPQMPPTASAPYGYHHIPSDPAAAPPPPPVHSHHGYGTHDPSISQHSHDGVNMGALPNPYTLWEQSSGTTELSTHSWKPPLSQENLSFWDVAMSTVPSEDHIVLMPGEANRTGQFWHRNAISAVYFEVQFGFGVFGRDPTTHPEGPAGGDGQPEGFAFWYVYEPYASVYPRSPEEQANWNLIGYKNNPKGFGVIFKTVDQAGNINPSISCIHNTEDNRELAKEISASSAFFYQYRNKSTPVLFRVIVGNQGVVAQIRESVASAWVTACSLEHVHLHAHGFIGFTAHNGIGSSQAPTGNQPTGDQVVLNFVKVWSLDHIPTQPAAPVPQHAVHPMETQPVATSPHAHSAHPEHYGIYPGATHDTSHIGFDASHADQTLMRMLTSIGNQISMLSVEVSDLRQDLRKLWGEEGPEAVRSIKSELTGFKDLFKRHSQQHTSALHNIHKHVETKSGSAHDRDSPILSRLTDLSSQLEKDIAVKHASAFLLAMAALVLVVLFALCSWRKFRAIEKKHML
ncbi:lectin-domain protein, putative [Eimeria necatrix]|uniref:Lectin-domain protein, putative n=1 Tax=Eimeria necatrix TaxID=51315 RepID=U6N1U2_9EIME|nr:lectin-domain protein, putative [Eimeria necatrix]CDJ68719.1 lectin-domain protein, putative [Eimeria necatrix]